MHLKVISDGLIVTKSKKEYKEEIYCSLTWISSLVSVKHKYLERTFEQRKKQQRTSLALSLHSAAALAYSWLSKGWFVNIAKRRVESYTCLFFPLAHNTVCSPELDQLSSPTSSRKPSLIPPDWFYPPFVIPQHQAHCFLRHLPHCVTYCLLNETMFFLRLETISYSSLHLCGLLEQLAPQIKLC